MVKSKAKRPLIWVSSAFIIGIAGGVSAAKSGYFAEATVIMLAAALLFALIFYKQYRSVAVVTAIFVAAAFFYSFFVYGQRNVPDISNTAYSVSATVSDVNRKQEDTLRFEAVNVTLDGESLPYRIYVTVKGGISLLPGDRITFNGKLLLPSEARNSGLFDYRSYLADNGIMYVAYVELGDVISVDENADRTLFTAAKRFQSGLIDKYSEYLTPEALGIISSVSLGDKVCLDENTSSLYRASGTAHLLAISGLHVGFIVLILSFLTRPLKKNGWLRLSVNLLFIWAYIVFTGASVSAVRAGIFFSLFSLGSTLKVRRDTVNISFATALIMLLFNPMLLFSVSFQLSFSAVLGLGLLSPKIRRFLIMKLRLPSNAANDIATVFAASVSVLPVIAYHFNTVSLVSVFANFIVVPLFSYVVIFSVILPLTVAINIPFIIDAAATVINGLVYVISVILKAVTDFEFSALTVPTPSAVILVAFAVIILLLSVEKPLYVKHRFIGIAVMLFIIAADVIIPFTGAGGFYDVSFLDVGQAECAIIRTPSNNVIMVDAGTSYGTENTAEYVIVPFLLKHGNAHVDYLVLSHPHSDHIGEAENVMRRIPVGNLVLSIPDESVEEDFASVIRTANELGVNVINIAEVETIQVDMCSFLNRVSPYFSDKNENGVSLLLEVSCGKNSILFAGDMGSAGLDTLPDTDNLLIYKVAHHGSASSISERIAELRPLYSVICAKDGNSYGLPDKETVDFLDDFSTVMMTGECGEISFRFSNDKIAVFRYKNDIFHRLITLP